MAAKRGSSGSSGVGAASKRGKTTPKGVLPGASHMQGGILLSDVDHPAFTYPDWIIPERARLLTEDVAEPKPSSNCVMYWMSRDQRAEDNWAMLMARQTAENLGLPLVVVFNLVPGFLGATVRQFGFMLSGLAETEAALREKQVPLHLLRGADPGASVASFATGKPAPQEPPAAASGGKAGVGDKLRGKVVAALEGKGVSESAARALLECLEASAGGSKEALKDLTRRLAGSLDPKRVEALNSGQVAPEAVLAALAPSSSSNSSSSSEVAAPGPTQAPLAATPLVAAAVFVDMAPLKVPAGWVNKAAELLAKAQVPLVQVDAHNIVPVWVTSDKAEVGARTIRKKVHAHLPRFLHNEPPPLAPNDVAGFGGAPLPPGVDWKKALASLEHLDRSVKEVGWATPGAAAGLARLELFCGERVKGFDEMRNDPNELGAASNLSPWLHFGQIAPQRAVLAVKAASAQSSSKSGGAQAFVEEAVVRRELSDNFCFYTYEHDSLLGASKWARDSLELHAQDPREYTYSRAALEAGRTHDDLWNAAQLQLGREGKMHGFLRMYWAKKILEWSAAPAEALSTSIYLNDKYSLDGRDPNGFVGCMWSICGTHDMGWTERPIFGKIRFMNYAGCLRKFDVAAFVERYSPEARDKCRAAGGTPQAPKKKRATKAKKK